MNYIDMEKETKPVRIVNFISNKGGYARMKELKEASFKTADVKTLVKDGILDKIKPGL